MSKEKEAKYRSQWEYIKNTDLWKDIVDCIERSKDGLMDKCATEPSQKQVYRYNEGNVSEIVTVSLDKYQGQIESLNYVMSLPDIILERVSNE